ncbi:hypothetical protein [Marinomonas mediterranea]|uniref:Uncharacterized protein n=1 Tax=Marinomonas mediterranea (strain ATCC 700492 / JCM 21426 / NBRC 103028 / MMB-1) TaxID=717774 RepID=F2K3K9_MARM1|nr:hypothetical protein [Marinomonas mediterranea]ADZ92448.1 hypothetical protein Marme_3232 [Marinomonas mediterranea MMB-1]WCN10399.1 hypothetical protein GV055_16480 [Marinomonas mediterranea]WCN14445.1 hypothetical protein GV054_16305 [Marinomonas mediterranea]WCN18497.1 hypothetical protein GV053_16370 [Marinomonas mediterranea MMB-1]
MVTENNNQNSSIKISDFIIRHSLLIVLLVICAFGSGYKYINEAWQSHSDDATYFINIETRIIELKTRMLMLTQIEDESEFLSFALATKLNISGIASSLVDEGIETSKLNSIHSIGYDAFLDKVLLKSNVMSNLALLEDQRFVVDSARLASELSWWKYGDRRWLAVFVALVLASLFYFVFFAFRVQHRIEGGVHYLHTVVDKLHNPNVHALVPFERKDEFSELARYVESTILNIRYDLNDANNTSDVFKLAFQYSASPVLIISRSDAVIEFSNRAFNSLWAGYYETLSRLLQIDWSLDTSEDGVFEDLDGLISQNEVVLKFATERYVVRFIDIDELGEKQDFCFAIFEKIDPVNELTVLNASVSLMANGAWNVPIRIMDPGSAFYDVSTNLEGLRNQVQFVFNELQNTNPEEKAPITKLQQIPTVFHQNIHHNQAEESERRREYIELRQAMEDLVQNAQSLKVGFNAIYANLDTDLGSHQHVSDDQMSDKIHDAKLSVLDVKRAILPVMEEDIGVSHRRNMIDLLHDIDLVIEQLSIDEKSVSKVSDDKESVDQHSEIFRLLKDCSVSYDAKLSVFVESLEDYCERIKKLEDELFSKQDDMPELNESDSQNRLDSWDDF